MVSELEYNSFFEKNKSQINEIIRRFDKHVRNQKPNLKNYTDSHDGKGGHWLEDKMGIHHNADNKPDLLGFEQKNETTSKTTFGDWMADYYIYDSRKSKLSQSDFSHIFGSPFGTKQWSPNRDVFLRIFGKAQPNNNISIELDTNRKLIRKLFVTKPNKEPKPQLTKNATSDEINVDYDASYLKLLDVANGRSSWSGEPVPKVNQWNKFGQRLKIDADLNIIALYDFKYDKRTEKHQFVDEVFHSNQIVLAKWNASSLSKKLEDKFNQRGWFKCVKNKDGIYTHIVFGCAFNYKQWLEWVKDASVILDSGMMQFHRKPYQCWRASNKLWRSLQFKI
jgi:hypothetical protein